MRVAPLWTFVCLALIPAPARARPLLREGVTAILAEAGPGTRWGVVVTDAEGREVIALDPEGRYMPASNTKILTTAAAFWAMSGSAPVALPATARGASVSLQPSSRHGAPDVVLAGYGDAQMSSAEDCVVDCLRDLADRIVANGTRKVHDVIGDDRAFPDERWSPGMSWNNTATRSGTGLSALTVDDGELPLTVTPAAPGQPPSVTVSPYYTIDNRARTVAEATEAIGTDRLPGARVLLITGTIGGDRVSNRRVGIDDSAEYAAWRLAALLKARGVKVTGSVLARHRPLLPAGELPAAAPAPADGPVLASLTPPPTAQDLILINKVSQNLHAELLLRRLGAVNGTGSIADGLAVVTAMLGAAGVAPNEVSLSDGSGMSTYNRVTPRGMVRLLRWIARQSWGAPWRATLPVGGRDGTLARRFIGTTLADGQITAKTGSLNGTNAIAGYMTTKGGSTLTFAAYANDVPDGVAATAIIDRALVYLAEHY